MKTFVLVGGLAATLAVVPFTQNPPQTAQNAC
jgi:hypothetical protein